MRIAVFTETYHPYVSGVVTHIDTLKQTMEAAGHEVLVVAARDVRHQTLENGVLYCPGHPAKRFYGYALASPWGKARFKAVKAFAPDVIHLHTEFSMGLFGLATAKKLRIPVVYTLHTQYDDYLGYLGGKAVQHLARPFAHAYLSRFAKGADVIVTPSAKAAAALPKNTPTHLVPNTVALPAAYAQTSPAVTALKRELGIRPGDTCLTFVGRLGAEKSIDELLHCFAAQFGGEGQYKLFLIGAGPNRPPWPLL